jgi:hypothetical protein
MQMWPLSGVDLIFKALAIKIRWIKRAVAGRVN